MEKALADFLKELEDDHPPFMGCRPVLVSSVLIRLTPKPHGGYDFRL
ncbi:MAG: hypothetical protein ACFUZC_22775 [Chthoniobacteraceae bacterium]